MKNCKQKFGVTLVEILVVVVVIAILAGMVIGLARRIDNQGKEQLVKSTFEILNCALEQFADYGYRYKNNTDSAYVYAPSEGEFYIGLDFPLDCNDYPTAQLETTLAKTLLGSGNVAIGPVGVHDPNFSGSEAMYLFLSKLPESRETLERIDRSLITNKDSYGNEMKIDVGGNVYPLLRVIDPWGKTLRYDYYDEFTLGPDSKKTFPVITSAGPDRAFDTADDISSRD